PDTPPVGVVRAIRAPDRTCRWSPWPAREEREAGRPRGSPRPRADASGSTSIRLGPPAHRGRAGARERARGSGMKERQHRVLVRVLFAVALVTGLVGMFAVWANRQVLNTDNWTDTSSRLLENKNIQNALGAYMVDQLF